MKWTGLLSLLGFNDNEHTVNSVKAEKWLLVICWTGLLKLQ